MARELRVGQRLAFEGALCTVRYIGEVEDTKGDWLGVEWDDSFRGKHSGEHKGKRYFTCINDQPTSASFVRPTRPVDKARTFLEALHYKYASEFEEEIEKRKAFTGDNFRMNDIIEFNGKIVEEVGFEKIRKQLAELQELKIVLLDGLLLAGVLAENSDASEYLEELQKIKQTCPKITELDLSRNLLERWQDVQDICRQLTRLKSLKLNGNRLEKVHHGLVFDGIIELHLDQTFMPWDEITQIASQFLKLESLSVSANNITYISSPLPVTLKSLVLEHNEITSLSSLRLLSKLPHLTRLVLRGNNINTAWAEQSNTDSAFQFTHMLKFLDISYNKIDSWLVINALSQIFPGLDSLRITGNPLYDKAVAATKVTGFLEWPMTVDEAFMLTLARLESLERLNYSKITPQDRLNGELYYLSLIGKELSATSASDEAAILATHPRYSSLCEIYGAPTVTRNINDRQGTTLNPRSVAARLVEFQFYQTPASRTDTAIVVNSSEATNKTYMIPRSFDVYRVKGIVSRLFSLPPLGFRLIWETDEWDPVAEFNIQGGEEWDSDDSDDGDEWDSDDSNDDQKKDGNKPRDAKDMTQLDHRSEATLVKVDGSRFKKREVELVDSTTHVGFWIDDKTNQIKVRVEPLQ